MTTDPTSRAGAATNGAATTPKTGAASMGQDAFLKLLVTQLENQDPTSPQDNGEFIAQLATFSSLEKLSDISSQLQALRLLVQQQGMTASDNA